MPWTEDDLAAVLARGVVKEVVISKPPAVDAGGALRGTTPRKGGDHQKIPPDLQGIAAVHDEAVFLVLPWPVSTNHTWRSVNGRVVLSAAARRFRIAVSEHVLVQWPRGLDRPLRGRLDVTICLHAGHARGYDLDNFGGKALLDALQSAGVFVNDQQIDRLESLRGRRMPPRVAGQVDVTIATLHESKEAR